MHFVIFFFTTSRYPVINTVSLLLSKFTLIKVTSQIYRFFEEKKIKYENNVCLPRIRIGTVFQQNLHYLNVPFFYSGQKRVYSVMGLDSGMKNFINNGGFPNIVNNFGCSTFRDNAS